MIIRCLGAVGAVYEGELTPVSPAQRRILGILTAAGPDGLDSASFADELWVDKLPGDWESAVRMAVSRLRRAIPSGTIERAGGRYRLALRPSEVDVWALLEPPTANDIDDATARQRLTGQAYPHLDPSPLLRRSEEAIVVARVRLIEWMALQPTRWSQHTLQVAQTLARQQLHNEHLFRSVASLHIAAGETGIGRSLLEEGIDYLRSELGVAPSQLTARLRDGIAHQGVELTAAEPQIVGAVVSSGSTWIDRPHLAELLENALSQHGALLTGEPGSGKTVAANRLALEYLERSHHVVRIVGRRDAYDVYGPFLSIDASVTNALAPLLDDGGTAFAQATSWLAALDALQKTLVDLPVLFVIDDAQWLDSHSQRFVEFLVAAQTTSRLKLLVVGRTDALAPTWSEFRASLIRAGLQEAAVDVFTPAELTELIGRQYSQSTSKQRADLATQLERIRAASPAMAIELIRRADPDTLVLAPLPVEGPAMSTWTDHVSDTTLTIAKVAAIVGMSFRIDQVTALSEVGIAEVYQAVDELLDTNLVVAEQRPDEFSFRHVLIHRAFEDCLSRAERRTLHLMAADSIDPDVHRRARHLHAAGALSDSGTTIAALVDSARQHCDQGSFSEAVASFAMADSYGASSLAAADLQDYADALDRSGADGWQVRDRAFALAISDHDHELAVQIAVSGALETEDIEGDLRRADMLRQVSTSDLSAASLMTRDVALARELGLLGRHEEALALSALSATRSTSADEAARAWLGAWPSIITRPVSLWPDFPGQSESLDDPELQSRMTQTATLRALLHGQTSQAQGTLARFCRMPFTTGDGLRAWYAMVLESLVSFTNGEWQRADELADQALAHGQRVGIASAFSTRAAQLFAQHWLVGNHVELLPLLDVAAPDVGSSLLAEAAYAVTMAKVPERVDAATLIADRLVTQMRQAATPFSAPAAAVLTTAPAEVLDHHCDYLRSILLPFSGTHLVVGTGIASLGPASRSLSFLAKGDERVRLITTAVRESDAWELPAWSVRCRLDLATVTGDNAPRAEAEAMAPPEIAERLLS